MSINTLGKLVLLVIIAVAIIVFVVVGLGSQSGLFNRTSTGIIGNLTDKASDVSEGLIIK